MHIVATHPLHRPASLIDPTTDMVALEPGGALGRRAGSPAGIVLVLRGSILIEREGETEPARAGTVALLAAGPRQTLRNAADTAAHIVIHTPSGAARPIEGATDPAGAAAD